MDNIKFIPAYVHGILDYATGVLLLLAPNLFGFAELGGAAVWVPRVIGIAILGMAVMTNNRVGLMRVVPMSTHLLIDYVVGIFLAISPFIFRFSAAEEAVWLPHLLIGIMIFALALLTETTPETEMSEPPRTVS